VHVTPAVDDVHVNGPRVIDCPYCSVGVPSPAFERHCWPVHSVNVLSVLSVTDAAGENVRQKADVMALGPRLLSISQLMFFEGDRNSVEVWVCGCRVPDVVVVDPVVVDVVRERSAVVEVTAALVVDVVEAGGADPLEHAAIHSALVATSATGARRRAHRDVCISQRVGRPGRNDADPARPTQRSTWRRGLTSSALAATGRR
jgi:hypothetical protein